MRKARNLSIATPKASPEVHRQIQRGVHSEMIVDVKYLQKRGKAGWRYRRKVPLRLMAVIGKREVLIPLGSSEVSALRRYPRVNAAVDRQFADAKVSLRRRDGDNQQQPQTPLELFQYGLQELRAMGFDPNHQSDDEDSDEVIGRDAEADRIISKYRLDDEGYPLDVQPKDAAILRALFGGAARPAPTIEDARRLYLKERVGDDEKKRHELERVFALVETVLQGDRVVTSLRREDAKDVRDTMLDGRKPSSVDRYLNVVRAVLNHAAKEYDLTNWRNPFMGLEVGRKSKAEPDRDKRRPFTEEERRATHERILALANDNLQRIWRILEGTGCRLAEVTGLRVEDVNLTHAVPHIVVQWHDNRRIKNAVSHRRVPLIGDALLAAKEALNATNSSMLFPAYGRINGASSASAALGKHVRACVPDPKVTTHSLRHLMKDRLRIAEVTKADQDIVLGHSSGSVGEDYGGDEARLKVAERALIEALRLGPN